jgi:hypothetical protein
VDEDFLVRFEKHDGVWVGRVPQFPV